MRLAILLVLVFTQVPAHPGVVDGQASALAADAARRDSNSVPSIAVPHAPADILALASTMNGVDVSSAQPWHVELSYDQFDEDGDNVHSGTVEEFYVGPKKWKRIYRSDTLNQTDIANDSGLYRSGDQGWPQFDELQVQNESLRPLYRAQRITKNIKPDKIQWQVGNNKLPCVILRHTDLIISDNGLSKFCFDPDTVMLRYTRGEGWDETTYNSIVLFQGRYVARSTTVTQGGKPFLKIQIDELESMTHIDDVLFHIPDDAKPIGGRVAIPSAVFMDEYLISDAFPDYPRGVIGKVNVKFVVGKDGRVIEATALDGPEALREPVVKAVRKYRFRPFLVLDQPAEVESSTSFQVSR